MDEHKVDFNKKTDNISMHQVDVIELRNILNELKKIH